MVNQELIVRKALAYQEQSAPPSQTATTTAATAGAKSSPQVSKSVGAAGNCSGSSSSGSITATSSSIVTAASSVVTTATTAISGKKPRSIRAKSPGSHSPGPKQKPKPQSTGLLHNNTQNLFYLCHIKASYTILQLGPSFIAPQSTFFPI